MIPKLHAKGSSFRGVALYVLHDKEADTSERVEWTHTRNLATNNPDAAWRVMAATAMDAARLKHEAGIKTTGRKSKDSVLHFTLSWHPDESAELTKDEMIAAAEGALTALKADDHQALIVCHNDEEQAHVHVVTNRVSMEDGRMLSSSKEKLALSRWAETYEKARVPVTGKVFCEERVLNNAARDRGTFVRAKKDVPRHIFELQRDGGEALWALKLREQQQAKDLEVRRKGIAQKTRHKGEWQTLQDEHAAEKAALKKRHARETTIAKQRAGEAFLDEFAKLAAKQEQARHDFVKREETLFGKGLNILRSIDWTGLLRQERRSVAIKEAFGLLAGRVGSRSEALRLSQQRETLALEKREAEAKRAAATEKTRQDQARLQELRMKYLLEREGLVFRHGMERSEMAAQWQERRKQRTRAWEQAYAREATQAFDKSATPEDGRMDRAKQFMGRMRRARVERAQDIAKSAKDLLKKRKNSGKGPRDDGRGGR